MHHALHIEEILRHILSYCYTRVHRRFPLRRWQPCYANVHLAMLARTCRAFKETALDMIWAELDDLTPLVRCLPNGSWVNQSEPDVDSVYSLGKRLEQTEWDIILNYARRVRALPCLSGSAGLAPTCIEVLSKPPLTTTESIFPNLRVVGLHEPSAEIASFVRQLLNSKVTDISFERTETLGSVIDAFGSGCPFVTDFCVSQWAHSDAISNLICHWENLRSVHCYSVGLKAGALTHLSRLRNLRHMSFEVHDAVVDQIYAAQSPTLTLTFPTLYDLRLGSSSLTPTGRLLHQIRVPMLHDLFIGLDSRSTAPDLMAFFVALQQACTHTSLNKLSLRVHQHNEILLMQSMKDSQPYYINFNRLLPLAVFVNIRSITLDVPCGVELNERQLLTLASSWPHLEVFEVGEDYDWTPSSAITPEGFLQLLERCRSLRVLFFMLDTRGYTDIPQGHPWRGLRMPKNTFLHLHNSPIEQESIEALGVFFHVAPYPDFNLTTHWNNRYFRGNERPQEVCDMYYGRWVEARDRALELWEKRKKLRHSLETRSL